MWHFLVGRIPAFKHALAGIKYVLITQKNSWIHATATILVILFGFIIHLDAVKWAVIILTIGLVWTTEILNTSIETIVDHISPEKHPLAKIAKDTGAGAVFITAATAVGVGIAIFGPPICRWVSALLGR